MKQEILNQFTYILFHQFLTKAYKANIRFVKFNDTNKFYETIPAVNQPIPLTWEGKIRAQFFVEESRCRLIFMPDKCCLLAVHEQSHNEQDGTQEFLEWLKHNNKQLYKAYMLEILTERKKQTEQEIEEVNSL